MPSDPAARARRGQSIIAAPVTASGLSIRYTGWVDSGRKKGPARTTGPNVVNAAKLLMSMTFAARS
jgi:hypothetical protein